MAPLTKTPNHPDENGRTPIHIAASVGQADIVKLLLDVGAAVDEKNDDGDTALHLSAWQDRRDTVRTLLARGADTQLTNLAGQTPADRAEEEGLADMVSLLRSAEQEQPETNN